MAKTKKVSINVWVIILFVVLALVLCVASFLLAKSIYDKQRTDFDRISKWGMSFEYKEDTSCISYNVNHTESLNQITFNVTGKFLCIKPGETDRHFYFSEISGVNDRPICIDTTGKLIFDVGSFTQNGTFYCPLIFHFGKDSNGREFIIDGSDYIGRKYDFEKDINDSISMSDIEYLPKGTNVGIELNNLTKDYYIELPANKLDIYDKISNATYDFEIKYDIREVK